MKHPYHVSTQEVAIPFRLLDGSKFELKADYCPACGKVIPRAHEILDFYAALDRSAQVVEQRIQAEKESEAADHESTEC